MNRVEVLVRRFDRFQQSHGLSGLPFAVIQKFGNDQAGGKATVIAYYALFAIFPLLLLFSTVLGFVLGGDPGLQHRLLSSALADFPIIGTQLRSSAHPLRGSGIALALGVLGSLYGAQGVGQAAQNAMNTVWNVPFKSWQGFVGRWLRGFAILLLLGLGVLVSTTLVGFAPALGPLAGTWTWVASTAVNGCVFLAGFTMLTAATVRVRDVVLGAMIATAFWEGLLALGTVYVRYVIGHANDVTGFFAIVIGLLTWLYTGARLTLLAAEINVVLRYRLWPRSMTQPPFTPQDKTAFVLLAKMEERRPEESVTVSFSAEADRQPLDESAAPAPPPETPAPPPETPAPPPAPPPTPAPQTPAAPDREEARTRLREATTRLAADAALLSTGSAAAREVGLGVRIDDLRQAVLAAAHAGVPLDGIAAVTGLGPETIELWIAAHERRHRR